MSMDNSMMVFFPSMLTHILDRGVCVVAAPCGCRMADLYQSRGKSIIPFIAITFSGSLFSGPLWRLPFWLSCCLLLHSGGRLDLIMPCFSSRCCCCCLRSLSTSCLSCASAVHLAMAWALPSACFSLSRFYAHPRLRQLGLSRPAGLMPFQITYKRQKAAAGTPQRPLVLFFRFDGRISDGKLTQLLFPPRSQGSRS